MKRLSFFIRTFLFASLAVVTACGGCEDDVTDVSSGSILVTPNPIAFSEVDIGDTGEIFVVVSNNEPAPLTVFEMRLEPREGGTIDGLSLEGAPEGEYVVESTEPVSFSVQYTPTAGQDPPAANLVFVSSDPRFTTDEPLTVPVDALGNSPRIDVTPNVVRFTRQAPGSRDTQEAVVRNFGSAPLVIYETPGYSGGEDFRVQEITGEFPRELLPYDPEAASDDPESYELTVQVEYAPAGNGEDTGQLLVYSNDPSGQREEGGEDDRTLTIVDIQASFESPCISVDRTSRDFGQVPLGSQGTDVVQIQNCGEQTLEVSDIVIQENSADDEFALDLGGLDQNGDGELDRTLEIRPGEDEEFLIRYTPAQEGIDTGRVFITSNDPLQEVLELDLLARGSEGECPIADAGAYIRGVTATPRQTLSAAPLQYIVLDGTESFDPDGAVVEYEWSILESPDGASTNLGPTQSDPTDVDQSRREYRLLTAGEYRFQLEVRDNEGFFSCESAEVVVRAIPNERVLVELTWTNPEDPDETDNQGSDVDLHLTKMGPGQWFTAPYDIYFRNPNNSGGGIGIWNPESPSLDIDDRDGGGPENIQMDDPSNCEWYAIGVHYYRQIFGTAYVTIRVYIDAQLVYENINKPLSRTGQFWDVARIHWDSGRVYDYDQVYEAPPAMQEPVVTPGMTNSGLCSNQNLYPVN